MKTIIASAQSTDDCTMPINVVLGKSARNKSKTAFPATPPAAAPIAMAVPLPRSSSTPVFRLRSRDTNDILSTVVPDKKFICAGVKPENISKTGLIMIPPPMPLIAPTAEGTSAANKKNNTCKIKSIGCYILNRQLCQFQWTAASTYAILKL